MTHALIYHDLVPPGAPDSAGFPGPLAARYKLDPTDFERHLAAIADTGARVGLAGEAAVDCAVTFDDGGSSALLAAELLEARGWRGHFFITSGRIGTAGFLSADEVRALAAAGHAVGSHSHSHPTYMGKLPRAAIAEEWRRSRDELGALLGTAPDSASVPGGFLADAVIEEAAAAGYTLLMTSEPRSRPQRRGALTVQGRYTIWATTSPRQAAGYASGSVRARGRLQAEWAVKRAAKTVAPGGYMVLRRLRARR